MSPKNQLGDLERVVMETLWGADEAWLTVRQVHEALTREREIAYTTVMTVLERLTRKGLVDQERAGRAFGYRPARSRGAMTAEVMREAIGEFAEDDRKAALVAFVGEASAADRALLREALAELDRRP